MSKELQSRWNELFDYCRETGAIRWKLTAGSRAKAGDFAGTQAAQGHLVIRVDGRLMLAHQIAWVITKGVMPDGRLKHVNGDKTDNRINNLTIATKHELHAHTKARPVDAVDVHSIFEYSGGRLFWRNSLSGKNRVAGKEAGHLNQDGYVVVQVAGKTAAAHRIVWLMHHGSWPVGEIDHRNGVRHDNRVENLRDVGHKTNTENRRNAVAGSQTGLLGVSVIKGRRYRARIRTDGKLVSLGIFDTAEAAHAAYVAAKRKLHAGNTL